MIWRSRYHLWVFPNIKWCVPKRMERRRREGGGGGGGSVTRSPDCLDLFSVPMTRASTQMPNTHPHRIHPPNIGYVLAQCIWWWANIQPTLSQSALTRAAEWQPLHRGGINSTCLPLSLILFYFKHGNLNSLVLIRRHFERHFVVYVIIDLWRKRAW